MSELAIIIASWNGRQHLEGCLPALREQTFRDFNIILVDNGSTDGTVDFVHTHFPEVEVVALPQNEGFAGPNNLGINGALADPDVRYVVALNNDTKPETDYLTELIACAKRHPEAGAVQPKVINFYQPSVIDSTGILIDKSMSAVNRGLKVADQGQYEVEEEIFGAAASAALYTRKALECVALIGRNGQREFFDGDYFAYYEDVDLAWRLRLAGFSCFYTPAARVFHVHSATGKSYSPFKAFYIHRNQYFNIIKNLPLPQLIRALLFMPRLYLASLLSVLKGRGAAAELARGAEKSGSNPVTIVVRGWWQVLRLLPVMLEKRGQVRKMRVVPNAEIDSWFRRFAADFDKIIHG